MDLKSLKAGAANARRRRRVGRGTGSGRGKTCGRGHKGQKARSGYTWHPYFEGGQMPLFRRLPKKGFRNGRFRKRYVLLNVEDLNRFEKDREVDPEAVQKAGLVKNLHDGLKILGKGEVRASLKVKAHGFSEAAVKKIEAAGGSIEIIVKRKGKGKRRKR